MAVLLPLLLLVLTGCGDPGVGPSAVEWPRDPAGLRYAAHGHEVLRVGDTLYAAGGFHVDARPSGRGTARLRSLRLPLGTWTDVAKLPVGRAFYGAARVGSDLYFVGESIDRYRPRDGTWKSWPLAGRLPKSHHGVVAFRKKLYILGGYPEAASRFQVFDPADGSLNELDAPPGFAPPDHLHVMAVLGDAIHVVGGIDGEVFEVGRAHVVFDGAKWSTHQDAPGPVWRKFGAACVVNGTLFVFGADRSLAYTSSTDTWRECAPMPFKLVMPAALPATDAVYVIGGRVVEGGGHGALRYDIASNTWSGKR